MSTLQKAFISYHHANDQWAKDHLVQLNQVYNIFIDCSVRTGDIDDNLPSQTIRRKVRDEWLRDSNVTILLVGDETRYRKHVDWEIKSSMINGTVNSKSGILVLMLPSTNCTSFNCTNYEEAESIYNDLNSIRWLNLQTKADYELAFPCLPPRISENLMSDKVSIPVYPWNDVVKNPNLLRNLIQTSAYLAHANEYDLSLEMRRNNFNLHQSLFKRIA